MGGVLILILIDSYTRNPFLLIKGPDILLLHRSDWGASPGFWFGASEATSLKNGLPFQGSISDTWVVVKIMVPFWVPNIVRHLLFRVPQKEP